MCGKIRDKKELRGWKTEVGKARRVARGTQSAEEEA